jgi:methyltransferase (TIGR00027 family)
MDPDFPHRTAYGVALSRAAHQEWDAPLVLRDPLAAALVGEAGRRTIAASRRRMDSALARRLRAFVVARARFADEELAQAHASGVRHCVVIGAGLDTLAWRHPYPDLAVYEVDHPGTQAWKLARLRSAGIPARDGVRFVPVDLARQELEPALAAHGLTPEQPAFFSLLGVSMYLPPAALEALLGMVARWAPRSRFVFDYVVPLSHHPALRRLAYRFFLLRLARIGEPWRGFFDPAALGVQLRALGFAQVTDLAAPEINARFFDGRKDGLAVGPSGHLVSVVRP